MTPLEPLGNRRQLLAAVTAVFLARGAVAQNAERRVEVALPAVGESRSFEDAISEYEAVLYVVQLREGQAVRITLGSTNAANCFDIHAPEVNKPVYIGGDAGNDHRFVARNTGAHVIRVYLLRFAARDGQSATFTLQLTRI